jgi:hypothetical protein
VTGVEGAEVRLKDDEVRLKADTTYAVMAACIVATVAFWIYTQTLLPGVDLGDSGGLQAAAIWTETSGRESYPLYYALGETFAGAFSPGNPARGLNLFSAVWAAVAAGLLTFLAGRIARSAVAGAAAGLLLAGSPTFWSQAIIAEVYTLHLALTGVCLLALLFFARQPGMGSLALFFAVYAASFGNHYSMILLLVPFTVFLLQVHPRPLTLFRPAILTMAVLIAAAGALEYTGNFLSVWTSIDAGPSWTARLSAFWFDTTKADWRETMVLGVGDSHAGNRLAMWWWDARQQFGAGGLLLAGAGLARLWWIARPWAVLVALAYLVSTAFALTYNVGDVHVFFLPGHFVTALAVAGSAAPLGRSKVPMVLAVLMLTYAGWRSWDTWPAMDRHDDRRPEQLVARVTQGISDDQAILVSQLDWQSENALLYASRHDRRNLAWVRLPDVLGHLPFLVADNHAIGRDVVLTSQAAADIVAAYGPLFEIVPDDPVPVLSLSTVAARLPEGTPYVLTLLTPTGGERLDEGERDATLRALTSSVGPPEGGPHITQPYPAVVEAPYQIWAGTTGRAPALYRSDSVPFRATFALLGDTFTVRMESWLPDDTFRRAGFGRVLRGREPVLTIERGVSFVWFQPDGSPVPVYAAGLYAPKPRFRIPAQTVGFARGHLTDSPVR